MTYHPLFSTHNLSDDDISKKINDAAQKLSYARLLNNQPMINQLMQFLSSLEETRYEREFMKNWEEDKKVQLQTLEFDWETLDDGKKEGRKQTQQGGAPQRQPQNLQSSKKRKAGPVTHPGPVAPPQVPRANYVQGAGIVEGEDAKD